MSQESEHDTTSSGKDSPSRTQQHQVGSRAGNGLNGDTQPLEFSSSASSTRTETGECEFLLPEVAKAAGEAENSHIVQEKGDEGDTCLLPLPQNETRLKPGTPLQSVDADHGDSVVVIDASAATAPHSETRLSAATADGIPDNLERCDSISTVNDYLTPNGSEMSITDAPPLANISSGTHSFIVQDACDDDISDMFSSSLDVFPTSKQHADDIPPFLTVLEASSESLLQSRTPTPPKLGDPPQILNIATAEATVEDCMNPDTRSQLDISDEEMDKSSNTEQTATILDISDQRVNFMNTPSSLSPISSHAESLEQVAELGYQRIGNARSSSSSSRSRSRSSSSNVSCLDIPLEHVEIPLTPSCRSPQLDSDPTVTSVTKLLPSSSSSIEVKHPKSKSSGRRFRRLFSWVKFKAMVEKKFSSIAGRFKHKDAGKKGFFSPPAQRVTSRRLFEEGLDDDPNEVFGDGQATQRGGRGPRLRLDSDGDEALEDSNNETSDRFYSPRMQWNVRGIYQRAASYVHSIWGRGS